MEQIEKKSPVEVYTPEDCYDKMLYDYENGKVKGTTTYNKDIDNLWTWRQQEFNILSGYANEGKSLWEKQMILIKALEEKRKAVFCSPEDFPPEEFYDDIIHTLTGQSTDKARSNYLNRELYEHAFDLIKDLFYFVYIKPPYNTIENVLIAMENLTKEEDIFSCVIDPIIKFTPSAKAPERDDKYAGYIGTLLTDFVRRTNTNLTLVMHQNTPKLTEAGLYPKPNMYNVKGGGSWSDGTDNFLFVQRPFYAKDKLDPTVVFGSQKIKKQKLVGVPGEFTMKFNRLTNRYTNAITGQDIFYFDKFLK